MSTLHQVVVTAVLVTGVVIELVAVLGLVVMRDVYDRLHYVGLAGFGALLVGASILIREGFSLIGNKAMLTGALIAVLSPVLVHATARSFCIRQGGDWRSGIPDDAERESR